MFTTCDCANQTDYVGLKTNLDNIAYKYKQCCYQSSLKLNLYPILYPATRIMNPSSTILSIIHVSYPFYSIKLKMQNGLPPTPPKKETALLVYCIPLFKNFFAQLLISTFCFKIYTCKIRNINL